MNINFQSDDLNWDNSVSSSSSAFSFDNDDIPNLNDKNPSNYSSKNVEKALSNQFHNLIIGEVSSAHLDTLQTTYVGFPKNTELEGGLKHKSRAEIAIESTKNITPQLEQLIFEYLNISLENAVGLSAKNYGRDFVKSQNSEEEDESRNNNNNNNNNDKEDEEDNEEEEIVFDQEITLNDKNEGKKPTFFNSLKSLFNKSKDNEANDDENSNTSLNDSSSWRSKANIKRSKSIGPKSNTIFHTDDKNDSKNGDENITESEEKSKKKTFFNSFPFFKSKTNDDFESNQNDENSFKNESNSSPKQIGKTQSSSKINFKNIFTKPKETQTTHEKTVRFANLNEEEEIKQPPNIGENIDQNDDQIPIEPENKQPAVMVENLDDFSSASDSDSDSQRCHTPNSNPSIEDDLFVVQESDQETDEEMVKNLIRPPTPEKEVNIKFSSESEPFDKKLNKKQEEEEAKEISFDSDTNSGNDSKNNNNQNNSFHSNESKSTKDQDMLLSASESESETASSLHNDSKNNNKLNKDQNDKKTKSNLYNLHLSSSSSEPEDNNDEKSQKNKAKNEIDDTKTKGKSLIELGQNEEVIKQTMSNVEFIANELSDFQVDQKDITNDQLNSPQTNSQTQKTIKYSNPKLNKRQPLKISNQSSQTNTYRDIQSRRKQNIIQENTYFEVFEDKTNMKRVRRKKINLTVNVRNDEEEENENQILKSKKRFVYANSNSSSQNSPKGRSSNSSSPHSNRHNYSPVHTHTHTPVPVKPRLILKNNSSSDDYDDDDFEKRKIKSNRIETDTPKSNKHRTIRRNTSISTENSPSHDKSSPPPAIRKRKSQIKSRKIENENYNIAEFHNSASPKKKNQRRDEIDDDEKESLSPITQTTRLVKRKKRASSEKRIKTRNPQLTISTIRNKKIEIEEEEEEKEIEESSKRSSRKKIVKKRRKPSLSTSQTQTMISTTNQQPKQQKQNQQQNNSDEIEDRKTQSQIVPASRLTRSSSELKSRTLTSSSRSRRRLSADNSLIDKKALAKNGVRSIILIEFDKKTPLIENLLEQFSSNTETLSLPSPKARRRRSHSVSDNRITQKVDNDDEETAKSSRSVRPKITRHGKNRSLNRSKITDQNDENDELSISFDDELNTKSESRVKKIRKRRQNSVKPSSLNRTTEPQKRNISDLNKKEEISRSVKGTNTITITRTKTETEYKSQPLRKTENSGRRRMESVKSERTLKRNVEQSEDYHNIRFNFKKLFDEAERNERRENQ